jgi:hypothetical protein
MTQKKRRTQAAVKRDVVKNYENSLGNVSATCRNSNISRETFYRWFREDPAFAEKINDVDEANLDFTESMLLKNIREGKEASIFFHLKTKGKRRGYIETVEQDITINPFLTLMKEATSDV